jgi:hypothetical protein
MKRSELEHLIRAASALTGHTQFVICGSQALLALGEDAPEELISTLTADLFVPGDPQSTQLIGHSLGEMSVFDQTFQYCARAVNEEEIALPEGWRDRVFAIDSPDTAGATGYCLEVHDLVVSKLASDKEDDFGFVHGLLRHQLADEGTIEDRLEATELSVHQRADCEGRFARLLRSLTL